MVKLAVNRNLIGVDMKHISVFFLMMFLTSYCFSQEVVGVNQEMEKRKLFFDETKLLAGAVSLFLAYDYYKDVKNIDDQISDIKALEKKTAVNLKTGGLEEQASRKKLGSAIFGIIGAYLVLTSISSTTLEVNDKSFNITYSVQF